MAQRHHRLTEQHIFESPGFEANGDIIFQLLTNTREEKGEKKTRRGFYCFCQQPSEAQRERTRGTGKIIQHHEREDRKLKFHVMKVCGGI